MLFRFFWAIELNTNCPIYPQYRTSPRGGSKHLGKMLQHAAGATAHTSIEDSHSNELFVVKNNV